MKVIVAPQNLVEQQNEVVAFVVSMPDMSKGIQKAKGKLFPFGFLHILASAKKTTQLDLLLGAVETWVSWQGPYGFVGQIIDGDCRKARAENDGQPLDPGNQYADASRV